MIAKPETKGNVDYCILQPLNPDIVFSRNTFSVCRIAVLKYERTCAN